MATKKTTETSAEAETPRTKKKKSGKQGDGARETVESIAIAFVLAFLFKTFQAEAYVIPTGSMAPTLYGRHKEITCDGCGFRFALGASSELDQESGYLEGRIKQAYCSNCSHLVQVKDAPVFNGDRILVNKQVSEFRRFDVVVFKNPEQGHVNYIKRLVGLPNETLRIRKGDLWVKQSGQSAYEIQRKAPYVQKDIQLTVYNDRFPPPDLLEAGWPERWEPCVNSNDSGSVGGWLAGSNGWSANREDRTYTCDALQNDSQWLRYRHFQPPIWDAPPRLAASEQPEACLISDFCSFNAYEMSRPDSGAPLAQPSSSVYWVGDLTINANVSVTEVGKQPMIRVELVEGPQIFECVIALSSGQAELRSRSVSAPSEEQTIARGSTQMIGTGAWDISFANVDDRLCLFVDGTLVEFEESTDYQSSDIPEPTQKDLAPAGIAMADASGIVSNLLLERDIYYRNDTVAFDESDQRKMFRPFGSSSSQTEVPRAGALCSQLNNPEAWARVYREETSDQLARFGQYGEYQLNSDEYLMFGDNSSMSKDSRLFDYDARPMNGVFSHRYAVRERDLIGKALFIFWPHGVPFLNDGRGIAVRYHKGREGADPGTYPSVRVPFYPNLSRMKKIR